MTLSGKARAAILFSVVFAAGATAWAMYEGEWPGRAGARPAQTGDGVKTVVAERAFVQRVVRQCHIDYGAPRAIDAPADGVLEILVEDGGDVEKGDLIARYGIEELESEERGILAEIDDINARLAFKSGAYRDQTEAIWKIEEEEKERERSRLEAQLEDMKTLEAKGQIAPKRLEEVRLQLDGAEAELSRFTHQRTLERAQMALDIDQMKHDLSVRKNRLADIGREKERGSLPAPDKGQVIWRDPQLAGAGGGTVRRGMALALLVRPGLYGAVVRIGDSDMSVVDGATVTISFGDGREPVQAQIASTRLVDDPIEQKRGRFEYDVAITFAAAEHEDVLHSQAICTFAKPMAPAPAIPASAVLFQGGGSYVMKAESGKSELVAVELGEVSGGYVRVLSGLKIGDAVVE